MQPKQNEKVAWFVAALWLAIIYVTIPFGRTIQRWVYEHLGRGFFVILVSCVLLVMVGWFCRLLWRKRKQTPARAWLWLAIVAGLYACGIFSLRHAPEESLHFVEYGFLAMLVFWALSFRVRDSMIYGIASLICVALGTIDEIIQWMIPQRYWDFRDVFINLSAAFLMQMAVALVWRPAFIQSRVSPRSVMLACHCAWIVLLLLSFCLSNTHEKLVNYRRMFPTLSFVQQINEVMIEYGHLHKDPDIGIFKSRLTVAQLLDTDRRYGHKMARVLDRYQGESSYKDFFEKYASFEHPFLYEARVHLFRRDRYWTSALKRRHDPAMFEKHLTVAFRENQILEKYFSNTLQNSSYKLPDYVTRALQKNAKMDQKYVSPVSSQLCTRISEQQIWSLVLICAFLLAGCHLYSYYLYGKNHEHV